MSEEVVLTPAQKAAATRAAKKAAQIVTEPVLPEVMETAAPVSRPAMRISGADLAFQMRNDRKAKRLAEKGY